jgi:hypothetical protein
LNTLAFFTEKGIPKTGLIPTVRIRDLSDYSLVVTDSTSEEVGDGWYVYFFAGYDSNKEYAVRFDGGPSLPDSERYTFGTNDSFVDDISEHVWDEDLTLHTNSGSAGKVLSDLSDDLKRLLGLTHENIFIDLPEYDNGGNLTSARVRIYSNPVSVGTDIDVIGTYQITAETESIAGKFTSWKQVKQ